MHLIPATPYRQTYHHTTSSRRRRRIANLHIRRVYRAVDGDVNITCHVPTFAPRSTHVMNAIVFSSMTFPTISTNVAIPSFTSGILQLVSTRRSHILSLNAPQYRRVIHFLCVPVLLHHRDQRRRANTLNASHTCQPT